MSAADDIDLLAAEYALGTLDAADRADVSRRLPGDPNLAKAVEDWQVRLSPLSEATPAVEPPSGLFRAIEARLFGARRSGREVLFWQISTAAFASIAAALLVWIVVPRSPEPPAAERLVAVLQKDPGAPAMILDVDLRTRRLTVRSVSPATPAGKVYELWLIDAAAGPPRPLGVVPARSEAAASLVSYDPAVISNATYAVTLEPPGGAPDGKPSGSPILSGRLATSAP